MCLNTCLVKKTCCDPLANGLKLVSHVFYIQYRFAAAEMFFFAVFCTFLDQGLKGLQDGRRGQKRV